MKAKHFYPILPSFLAGALLFLFLPGCDKNGARFYTVYEPIYTSRSAALAAINGNPDQGIDSAGKIYAKGSYIFVNDINKGIHIIDNRNPSRPVQLAFISIPGNQDIVIKDNTLYADMYDALLAIDISDVRHVKITHQLEDLFVMRRYVNGYFIPKDSVITGWRKKLVKTPPPNVCPPCNIVPMAYSSFKSAGIAGSMAKMVLLGDRLYALSESHSLQIINLENAAQPALSARISAGFDLETIYPFRNKLFLGSSSGVYIYDISNPDAPVANGTFWHGKACDPVITDGDYAYVTLHTGTWCGGTANELDVVNVKDLNNPQLVKSYPMTKPMGLSKDGNLLFVCDTEGVKVFDASDPNLLKPLRTIATGSAYDVIAANNLLLVSTYKKIYQIDYSKPEQMSVLSVLTAWY
ncbi:MAG: hypothetical protein J0H74_20025 [Chitinophagaceae bacterium]|nr:hypothetical protein [Chitinophagaceae bacterium]